MSTTPGFFEELKRRNVVRVGVAYLITAWLLAQVADLMLESFHAPEWVIQAILVVLIIGFPLALIFAWAYELTPDGLKKEKDVDRSQSITHKTGHTLDRSIIAILIVALGYFVWESRFNLPEKGTGPINQEVAPSESPALDGKLDLSPVSTKSIAVLPFVNMSSDAEQEYFSDGISEEILNALAQVKDLKVAGRTSSFAFKGQNKDLRQIGETLGVANILEGSVRKSGKTVRITAQLIQVKDGFHIWSDTYDRELTDVFVIQDEISNAILEQLKAHLLEGEKTSLVADRANSEAYDLYLLAKQRIYERSKPALESAAELLDKAIAIDATYAPAYAQRGITSLLLSDRNYGTIPQNEAGAQAKLYLNQALKLNPDQPEALAALGLYYLNRPGKNGEAIKVLEQALEINPNEVNASNWLQSAYATAGRIPEMIKILEDLRVRDPLYRPGIANLNQMYVFQNRFEEAQAQIEQIRQFMPNDPFLLGLEAGVAYAKGNMAQGLRVAEKALAIQPDNFVMIGAVGRGLDGTGQYERLAAEGQPQHRWFALVQLGRMEEATLVAQELAATGEDVGSLMGLWANYGKPQETVKFFEERWPDLDAYQADYPAVGGAGVSSLLDLAFAFRSVGNLERFDDAMQRSRAELDRLAGLGFTSSYLWFVNSVYFAMAGDEEQALAALAKAIDGGYVTGTKLSNGWAGLQVLEGNPEYEAIQARMIQHLNAERAELGLEPMLI